MLRLGQWDFRVDWVEDYQSWSVSTTSLERVGRSNALWATLLLLACMELESEQ